MLPGVTRRLWQLRMAAHVRARRARLKGQMEMMLADALAAFDAGEPMLANVCVYSARDGMRGTVSVDPGTVARRHPERPAAEELRNDLDAA